KRQRTAALQNLSVGGLAYRQGPPFVAYRTAYPSSGANQRTRPALPSYTLLRSGSLTWRRGLLSVSLRGARPARMGRTFGAVRPRWMQLIPRQFAVAVFIERLEGGAGVGDFGFVNHAIVVGVERGYEGRRWRAVSFRSGAAWTAGAVFAERRAV